eukprot:g17458.t1
MQPVKELRLCLCVPLLVYTELKTKIKSGAHRRLRSNLAGGKLSPFIAPEPHSKSAAFEEHWAFVEDGKTAEDATTVEQLLKAGLLAEGTLKIPAFHTETCYVELARGRLIVPGFVARNRAMNGDRVMVVPYSGKFDWNAVESRFLEKGFSFPKRRQQGRQTDAGSTSAEGPPPEQSPGSPTSAEAEIRDSDTHARVVAIRERVEKDAVVGTVVACGNASMRFQPRDSRLPAWDVLYSDEGSSSKNLQRRRFVRREGVDGRFEEAPEDTLIGHLVLVKFKRWLRTEFTPVGVLVRDLGKANTAAAEQDAILAWEAEEEAEQAIGLPPHFQDEFENEDLGAPPRPTPSRMKRLDLREDLDNVFSIDPTAAKDLDDAISVVVHKNKQAQTDYWRRIYDREGIVGGDGSLSGKGAFREEGSDRSQSLEQNAGENQNENQYTEDDVGIRFHRTRIKLRTRMDYDSVDHALQSRERGDQDHAPCTSPYPVPTDDGGATLESLRLLFELTKKRRKLRLQAGGNGGFVMPSSHSHSSGELVLETDADGWPTRFEFAGAEAAEAVSSSTTEQAEDHDSHKLIEELMVLANHVVARKLLASQGEQTMQRIHPDTSAAVLSALRGLLEQIAAGASAPPHCSVNVRTSACSPAEKINEFLKTEASDTVEGIFAFSQRELPQAMAEVVAFSALQNLEQAKYVMVGDEEEDRKGMGATEEASCRSAPTSEAEVGEAGSKVSNREESGDDGATTTAEGEDALELLHRGPVVRGSGDREHVEDGCSPSYHWGLNLRGYLHFTSPIRRRGSAKVEFFLPQLRHVKAGNAASLECPCEWLDGLYVGQEVALVAKATPHALVRGGPVPEGPTAAAAEKTFKNKALWSLKMLERPY